MILIEEYEREKCLDASNRDMLDLYQYIDWLEKQICVARIKPLSSDAVLAEVAGLLKQEINVYQMPQGDYGFTNGQISSDGFSDENIAKIQAYKAIIFNALSYINAVMRGNFT